MASIHYSLFCSSTSDSATSMKCPVALSHLPVTLYVPELNIHGRVACEKRARSAMDV